MSGLFVYKKMPSGVYKRKPISEETRIKMKISHIGKKLSDEQKAKISKSLIGVGKGKKLSKEHIKKLRESHKGFISKENNPNWKTDEEISPHGWIRKKLGNPNYCEHCKKTDKKRYDWSNKNHRYNKVIEEWQRLCRSCHMKYDVKFNNRRIPNPPK